ncbi:hypothetical protein V8G54_032167 [Vigna mungo]|uniref:Uncharacterized protein n=1 Tax=Vigna mungo TaxID=3915 RepID=A0AAQ3MLX5_VIGMU
MKTHDINFATRPKLLAIDVICYNCTDIAFAPYGNYWRQLRKICMLELSSLKRVNSYQPIREEEFFNLVKRIDAQKGSPINLTEVVLSSIYTIASRFAFGKKSKDQENFISVATKIIKVTGGFDVGDFFPSAVWLQHVTGMRHKLERLHQQADQIMENIINEHKEAKSKAKDYQSEAADLVDVLMQYEGDGKQDFSLTRNNIKAIILGCWCRTDFSQSRPLIDDPNGQNEEPCVWNLLSKNQLDPTVNDFTARKTPVQV